MGSKSAEWSVVSTVRAPKIYVNRFISHYLRAGAHRIFIFFDDPDLKLQRKWFSQENVVGVVCDSQYWQNIREVRSTQIEYRQQANVRTAISLNRSEWLLHVDSDEFMYSVRPIGEILARQAEDVFAVVGSTLEAVYESDPKPSDIFNTRWFKTLLSKDDGGSIVTAIYGDIAALTQVGFFGHVQGKSFFRTKYAVRTYELHVPKPIDPTLRTGVTVPGLELLHFQSQTFVDWREKWMRLVTKQSTAMFMSVRRRQQLDVIRSALGAGDDGLLDLYRKMNVFGPDRMAAAKAAGFVVEREL